MYNNKKKIIIIVMMALIMIMATGYAYFATRLNVSVTGNATGDWNVYFSSISVGDTKGGAVNKSAIVTGTTATITADLNAPGDSITYNIKIVNDGTIDAIIESIEATKSENEAIEFSIDGLTIGTALYNKNSTEAQKEKDFSVTIKYSTATENQPEDLSSMLQIKINVVQNIGQTIENSGSAPIITTLKASDTILEDNTAIDASTIDFTAWGGGDGALYYTSTNTENNKVTYFFRGQAENNYVKFAKDSGGNDLYWRIVRINEDGSIRIVYYGTSTETSSSIGTSKYNESNSDNAYVGYMYGLIGVTTDSNRCVTYDSTNNVAIDSTSTYSTQSSCQNANGVWVTTAYEATHTNVANSSIKDYLDTWYEDNLKTNYSQYIADAGFCNDRSKAIEANNWDTKDTALGYGQNTTYYAGYNRYMTYSPQFKCSNEERDLFTTSTSSKGNKSLKYPIGLITSDELVYSGITYGFESLGHLIHLAYSHTMSPTNYYNGAMVFSEEHHGAMYVDNVNSNYNVYPVINLKASSIITSGDGTSLSPYVILTN